MKYDDPTIIDDWELEALEDDPDFDPPQKVAPLIRQMNRPQCYLVRIEKHEDGEFFLKWKERHPEMLSPDELYGERRSIKQQKAQLHEYQKLVDVMPPKEFELPLSRQEAFALVVTCWMPSEFQSDAAALLG